MANRAAQVISAVCENKDIHVIMAEKPEIFGAYGDVYEFIHDYYMKHKAIPEKEFVVQQFPDIDLPPVKGATAFHLESLKREYVEARFERTMLGASKDTETPIEEKISRLLTRLSELQQYQATARDVNLKDIDAATDYFAEKRKQAELNGGTPGISMGFDTIDSAYTTGMAGGHAITMMGYSGKGKSMLAALIGVNAWIQGKKVMVISLEMEPEEYAARAYAMMGHGRFSIRKLENGDVDPDDFRTWANKSLLESPDFIVVSNEGASDVTPNTIQAKIDEHRPDLVILDYLQLMSDNAHTGDMTKRMLNLSRQIKLLAVRNAIPVISITAVTDEDNDKRDAPPLVSQVAWSKGIEYDSNLIIAVHRHGDTDIVEVVCRKNRHGDMFSMFFKVDFDAGIWEEKFDL
jgi:replicative DNA helicase